MQNVKARYAAKGSSVTQAGYETSIHALPQDVKQKLDYYLQSKYSPLKTLALLSKEFPNVSLPSKSALYNYRNRYFEKSLVSATPVAKMVEAFDADKINLKLLVVTQVKRFLAVDLPELRERWYKTMEQDHGKQQLSKETREAAKLYIEAVKVSMDIMPKLNITVELFEDKPNEDEKDKQAHTDALYEKLATFINRKVDRLNSMGIPVTPESLKRRY